MQRWILSQDPDNYEQWKIAFTTVPYGIFGNASTLITAFDRTKPRQCCEFHFTQDSGG